VSDRGHISLLTLGAYVKADAQPKALIVKRIFSLFPNGITRETIYTHYKKKKNPNVSYRRDPSLTKRLK
jgi:hypothetical protein